MDLCEQLAALLLGNVPHEDATGATADRVSLSQPHYALSRYMVFRKDVVFQVVPNLGDPCIETPLSIWMRHHKDSWISEIHASRSSVVLTILGGPHRWSAAWTASFEMLV